MEMEGDKICMNCAFAVLRDEKNRTRFPWCKLLCTFNSDEETDKKLRRIPYKYKHDTCENFLQADKPLDV